MLVALRIASHFIRGLVCDVLNYICAFSFLILPYSYALLDGCLCWFDALCSNIWYSKFNF